MLASRSATASDSSANAGSNVLSGNDDGSPPSRPLPPSTLRFADSRNDERDDGRSGVVGRDVRVREREREFDRFAALSCAAVSLVDMVYVCVCVCVCGSVGGRLAR